MEPSMLESHLKNAKTVRTGLNNPKTGQSAMQVIQHSIMQNLKTKAPVCSHHAMIHREGSAPGFIMRYCTVL